ncbi:hypothetical protein WBJ53_25270 [Spirosoma sp. SC4-14]|uniref:hypothetical protein n=1 Tax=Spirosoma sp. SC4-14 TaxID=3128900 RepID=UPI0030CB7913
MINSNDFDKMRAYVYGLWLLGVGWISQGCQLMARSETMGKLDSVARPNQLPAHSTDGEIEQVVNQYLDWVESNAARFEYHNEDRTINDEYGMMQIPADSTHPAISVDPTGMNVDGIYLSYNSYTQRRARIMLKRAKVRYLKARLN